MTKSQLDEAYNKAIKYMEKAFIDKIHTYNEKDKYKDGIITMYSEVLHMISEENSD